MRERDVRRGSLHLDHAKDRCNVDEMGSQEREEVREGEAKSQRVVWAARKDRRDRERAAKED